MLQLLRHTTPSKHANLKNHDDLSLPTEVIQNLLQQSQLSSDDIDGINISSAVWNLKPREALSMLGW